MTGLNEKKRLRVNRAGDINDAFFGAFINIDVVQFVAAEAGRMGDLRRAPERRIHASAMPSSHRPGGDINEAADKNGGQNEGPQFHFVMLRSESYTARVCSMVCSFDPLVSMM